MPYSNFDDTRLLSSLYRESQQEDTDMNIGEFIFEKLLTIGKLFEGKEEDVPIIPFHNQHTPPQVQMLQSGSLYCLKINTPEKDKEQVADKPTCSFRENKFSFDYHAIVFHPPALIA